MTRIDRRTFLTATMASLGAAASLSADRSLISTGLQRGAGAANPRRIDIHHHFAPPEWMAEVKGRPLLNAANLKWTAELSLADMDQGGVAASILSITNPGIWFGDKQKTRVLARACNEFGAKVVQAHPTRFGLFATLPLPDVGASLNEIAYAYDTLKTDGIGLLTSYDDVWLGNKAFRPVMEELNRRKAVIAVHPTAASCCRSLDYGVAPGSIEYGTDTTRAIIGVAFSGDATRFPEIRFIWSHAGGSLPFLAGRVDGGSRAATDALPNGFIAQAGKFYYDLAGAANKGAVASLLQLVKPSQILFGTDFPPGGSAAAEAAAIASTDMFDEAGLRAVNRDNAVRLLPRFA
jgi:predicted TIM-barrel fold metal-dependent hydrolase